MSTATITLDEADLKVATSALDAAGVAFTVKAQRVTKPAAALVEPFSPATGDDNLDAFMRASRSRRGAPKPRRVSPPAKFPYGLKSLTDAQRRDVTSWNEAAVAAWRRLGYAVEIEQLPGQKLAGPALDGRNVRVAGLVR